MTVGVRLTVLGDLRRARSMTQRELALRAGLNMSTISQLETGLGVASIRTIHLLARALNLPPTALLREAIKQDEASDYLA